MIRTASRRLVALGTLVLAVAAVPRRAHADADQAFRRGNDAYLHGNCKAAIRAYEQVASVGVESPDLFYNLGDAYYCTGDLGRAIYDYERALTLRPGDADAAYNLATARAQAARRGADRVEGADADPLTARLVAPFTLAALTWTALFFYIAFFGVLIWLRYVPSGLLRSGIKAACFFLGLATLAAGALLGDKMYLHARVPQAIVLDPQVAVKAGADETYRTSFDVHAGLKVRVIARDEDWAKIRLPNGLEGWVPEATLGEL